MAIVHGMFDAACFILKSSDVDAATLDLAHNEFLAGTIPTDIAQMGSLSKLLYFISDNAIRACLMLLLIPSRAVPEDLSFRRHPSN